MGLAEKAQAFTHQTWLEYGPSAASVRAGNARVRTILSDMGTELGIADLRDLVDSFVPGAGPPMVEAAAAVGPEGPGPGPFMFPMAIGVPGTQHILDNVLYSSVRLLELWPSFEKELKAVAQWLAPIGNRRALQHMLRVRVPEEQEAIQKLDRTMDWFAQWRWKTLSSCLYALCLLEPPLRLVTAVTTLRDLARRRKTTGDVDKFWAGIDSQRFWNTVVFLMELLEPMRTFAAWVRGCDCCEDRRKGGKAVDCPWAGCRAAGLCARWRQAMQELEELRLESQGPAAHDRDLVLSHMLGALDVKMRWVDDGPFLLWQLFDPSGPAVAGRMLAERDQLVEAGGRPHRVVEHFAGAGALRSAMSAFAAGAGMSAQLEEEVKSYCLGKIDDAWAEAGHRDASTVLKRCTSVRTPYVSAFLRSNHILEEFDRMDRRQRGRFYKLIRKWVAVAQPDARKARRLQRVRRARTAAPKSSTLKRTLGVVYRFNEIAMQEWDRQLGGIALSALSTEPAVRRSIVSRLQAEHVQATFPVGEVLSICDMEDGRLVACEEGPEGGRAGAQDRYFMVLNLHAQRQRRVSTTASHIEAQMACQVSVQRFEVLDRAGHEEGSSTTVRVRMRGRPEVVDFLDMFSWSALTTGVRQWTATAATEPGVRLLSNASPLPICDDWQDRRISTWTALTGLKDRGWVGGSKPPDVHGAASDRCFRARDPVECKDYLRCLLGLDTLVPADHAGLPSRQANMYYTCVLAARSVEGVPVGKSAKQYKEWLRSRGPAADGAGLLEDDEEEDAEGSAVEDNTEAAEEEEEEEALVPSHADLRPVSRSFAAGGGGEKQARCGARRQLGSAAVAGGAGGPSCRWWGRRGGGWLRRDRRRRCGRGRRRTRWLQWRQEARRRRPTSAAAAPPLQASLQGR